MTGTITNPRVRRSGDAQSRWFGPDHVIKLLKQRQKCPSAASLAQCRNLRILHWKMSRRLLPFVQRGRILLRCGSAFALSLPSLGVSSLDLGRLFTQAALFFLASHFGARQARTSDVRLHIGESRDSGFSPAGCPGMTRRVELPAAITPPPPGTARGRRAEPRPARRPGWRNPRPPGQTAALARVAAHPCRSRG